MPLRCRALAGVIVALLGLATIPAMGAVAQPSSGGQEAARASLAQTDAEALLSDLRLPEGAQLASSDPSVGQDLTAARIPLEGAQPGQAYADRFWRVPGEPQEVIAWIEAHGPAGASHGIHQGTNPQAHLTSFRFRPSEPEMICEEQLLIYALPAEGGGTALRAEGEVAWLPVRPRSERVPAHVKLIRIVEHQTSVRRPSFRSRRRSARRSS